MATQYANGKIVTDGLILALNAADRNSYVSGSTTWFDLTANNFTCSLVNGPAFNSSNSGNIIFDGVDDYANAIPSSYSLVTGSIIMFISHSLQNYYLSYYDRPNSRGSAYTGIIPTGIVQVGVTYNGTNHFFHINGNTYQADIFGVYAYDSVTPQSAGLFGRARNDSGTSDNVYTYNFSMIPTSSGYSGTPNANTFFENFTTSSLGFYSYTQCIIGKLPAVTRPRNFTGKIYNLNVYSKPLTDQEVLQNYNAQKSRFNL
jgi:hypothetical protein